MNPPPVTQCLECGATLSPSETQGLCARCLLKMGLASGFGASSVAGAGARAFVAPPMFPFDFGGYRVLRLLGRGGMGAVYEAEQRETGRRVALKVLGQTIDSPEMRKRFLREGRLAAAINHPNTVYIFGTEEIDATPVIAMELVAGGTLKDELKRRGPLPVRDAVDAILGVIAGLEAAHAGGVLHRDVKPANCFVAPDGTVKVGDFGLSVSTLARHDSQLTATGTMLGTPSYAPPEQLRGDDLDLRADIYSVGATLYSLLTGHAPFEGDNAVHVVTAVINDAPNPIASFRTDVPAALAQIVTRCLAKKREARFASYAEMRDALLRFSSQAHEPAPLGRRFVAGLVDVLCAFAPLVSIVLWVPAKFSIAWLTNAKDTHVGAMLGQVGGAVSLIVGLILPVASPVLYFAIAEGRWGATLGKALCGMRVVRRDGGVPGLWRGGLRAIVFVSWVAASLYFAIQVPDFLGGISFDWGGFTFSIQGTDPKNYLCIFGFLTALWATARKRNGLAAIHDWISGTRVILRSRAIQRPLLEASLPAERAVGSGEQIGPFQILGPLAGEWLLGRDEVLRRQVWIRRRSTDFQSVGPAGFRPADGRQDACRPHSQDGGATTQSDPGRASRLRWIAGARGEEHWDAFDAPTGKPLMELIATPQPWAAVRFWLLDLAEEFDAATKDRTLPPTVGLDHVWITGAGRALLLDEPWPGVKRTGRLACADLPDAQRFLAAVAHAALDRAETPLHARDFLQKLGAAAFDRMSFLAGNLRALLVHRAALSRRRRWVSLAVAPGIALLIAVSFVLMLLGPAWREEAKWTRHLELRALPAAVDYFHGVDQLTKDVWYRVDIPEVGPRPDGKGTLTDSRYWSGNRREGLLAARQKDEAGNAELAAKYIAGHFGAFVTSAEFDREPLFAHWSQEQREAVRAIVQAQPALGATELAEIDRRLKFTFPSPLELLFGESTAVIALLLITKVLVVACVLQLVSLLLLGATLGERLFGIAVVDGWGAPARRVRKLARWFIGWTPLFALLALTLLMQILWLDPSPTLGPGWEQILSSRLTFPISVALWIVWLAGFLAAIVTPARGWHDRLAGTRLVPR